ncbi:MAG: hypothetical protein WBY88_02270 [Desulfosarcina sp.]
MTVSMPEVKTRTSEPCRPKRTPWLASLGLAMGIIMGLTPVLLAADYHPLIGRWQRTDGGYVIEIKRIAADGAMQADYYNPNPIHVARAAASLFKEHLKVEVELQDTGYPGSTYTLLYDPKKDALLGLYYQAVQRQNYDVVFVRMK